MGRFALLGLVMPMLLACEQKKRSVPLTDQTVEITLVSAEDGGLATNAVMIGETAAFPLPAGDQPAPDRKPEMRAPGVYVVTLRDGFARPVYLGLGSLFFGPRLTAAQAAGPITYVGGASTAWTDHNLRKTVVQVTEERDLGELPAVLVAVSDRIDGPVWRDTVAALSEPERAQMARDLEPSLLAADGGNARLLAAALVVDLEPHAEAIAARLRALDTGSHRLAAAILLRSLAANASPHAGPLACAQLASGGGLDHADPRLAAALLALRRAPPADPGCLTALRGVLERDACHADARCRDGVSVAANAPASRHDEPVCTREEASRLADREAVRGKWELAEDADAPTTLLALAAAYEAKAVPPAFFQAHARRRYAYEPKGPPCREVDLEGAACAADEAELRDGACLAASPKAKIPSATFLVDATSKRLREVRRSLKAR